MWRGALGIGEDDAVEAHFQLADRSHAVGGAAFQFRLLDPARRVGRVRMPDADAGAELLDAAAGAGGFDDRGLELAPTAEGFGDGAGEGEHGGRADDADLVTALSLRPTHQCDGRSNGGQCRHGKLLVDHDVVLRRIRQNAGQKPEFAAAL